MSAGLRERLLARAEAFDREAKAEDNEHPEPDAYCSTAGGDFSRATAALLREAAAALEALAGEDSGANYENEVVQSAVSHWFIQGGEMQFGELRPVRNTDELISAILTAVRKSAPSIPEDSGGG